MIHQISSDLETFKTLDFKQGLNIVLADKSEGATNLQTRNSTGKSSLVELINFLCGSNVATDSIFVLDALINSSFDMVVDIGGEESTIRRSGKDSKNIQVTGHVDKWPILPELNESTGMYDISNDNWKHTLGNLWFGLDAPPDKNNAYQPSFRSLFPYLARRQSDNGFQNYNQHSSKQMPWNQQVAISYFLGLDWRISQGIKNLKEKEKLLKNFGSAVRSGKLGPHFEKYGDLRTKLTVADKNVKELRTQLNEFQVIPKYHELELEANEITTNIKQLGEENFIDRRSIDELDSSLQEEQAPDSSDLKQLYEEAGVVLPDLLQRRLDDVKEFHKAIIKNRRFHLDAELTSAKKRIEDRDEKMTTLDERRGQIMRVLKSGGAFEQYTTMQEELSREEANAQTIRQRLETAKNFESTKRELTIEQNRLTQALQSDIEERSDFLDDAINTFGDLSRLLYGKEGRLIINAEDSGPTFEINIDGWRGEGINNMRIFCFDLMLMELCTARGQSPGFLVHDSHLFDGVDKRQVAKALQLGAERAKKAGFQYIVTMNSDKIPMEYFDKDFNVNDYVLRTKLTDASTSGGLFGIRF